MELADMIVTQDIPIKKFFSRSFASLIEGLCTKSAKRRLTLKAIKKHSFFKKINWEQLQ